MTILNPACQMHNIPSGMTACTIVADTTGTAQELVAAVANKTTDVWGIILSAAGVTNITILSGTDVLMSFAMAAGSQVFLPTPYGPGQPGQTRAFPYVQTADGGALKIAWTGSIAVSGTIYAQQRLTVAGQ